MKCLTLVLALITGGCATTNPTPARTAEPVPLRVQRSVVRITGVSLETGKSYFTCTGFAIAPRKFMTAEHCVPEAVRGALYVLKVNDQRAVAIKTDVDTDLAILLVDLVLPPLSFRETPVERLEEVWGIGFGHGFVHPLITHHIHQIHKYNLGFDEIYPGNVYEHPFIGGMSGGPIFDRAGLVVGVVQRSSPHVAYGVDVDTIHAFLAK